MNHPEPPISIRLRPWWPVWMLGAATGALMAIAVSFTLITGSQRADRAERRAEIAEQRDDIGDAQAECRARFAAVITETSQNSRSALNDLVIVIANSAITQTSDDAGFERAIRQLEAADRTADQAITDRDEYLAAGSPLPCPLT